MPVKTIILAVLFSLSTIPAVGSDPNQPAQSEAVESSAPVPKPVEPPPPPERPFSLESSRLTGDWGGFRTSLEDHGVTVHLFHTPKYQAILKGGRDTEGGDCWSASSDVLISFDFDKMGVMTEVDGLIHAQIYWEDGINLQTGALHQVNDDADGDLGLIVDQVWVRKHWLNRRISLQMGYVDYQTIVDRNEYANSEDKQFWNQILDNNPLVPLNIGIGAALTLKLTDWYTLILGVGDAQSVPYKGGITTAWHDQTWYRAYMEHGFQVKIPTARGPMTGNYRLGMIYEPTPRAKFPRGRLDDARDGNDCGFFASFDQMLYRESEKDDQGLGVFLRLAYRDTEMNRMSRFYSAGFQYKGLIPERDQDVLGFAYAKQRSSHLYRERVNHNFTDESIYELYYAVQVTKWLVLSPDIQYVDNPGGQGEFKDVVTAGLRARITF